MGVGDRLVSTFQGELKLALKNHSSGGQSRSNGNQSSGTPGLGGGSRLPELRKSFRTRFVRLNGIIFTKTSLETFSEVYLATVRELEELLAVEDSNLESGLGSDHRNGIGSGSGGPAGMVQLIVILIYTLLNINWTPKNYNPTYAEVLQRSQLFQHSFTALFECSGRIVRRLLATAQPLKSPVIPAVLVLLEWLASHGEMAIGSEMSDRQGKARVFFWGQIVALLNFLLYQMAAEGQNGEESNKSNILESNEAVLERLDQSTPLWEDYELRGFQPLVPIQNSLDYSKPMQRMGAGGSEQQVRLRRILKAGKKLTKLFVGTGQGLRLDEKAGRFVMVGQGAPVKIVSGLSEEETASPVLPELNVAEIVKESSILPLNEVGEKGGFSKEEVDDAALEHGPEAWEEGNEEEHEHQEGQDDGEDEPAWAMEDGKVAPELGPDEEKRQKQKELELEQMRQMQHQEWQVEKLLQDELEDVGPKVQIQKPNLEEVDQEEVIVFRPAVRKEQVISVPESNASPGLVVQNEQLGITPVHSFSTGMQPHTPPALVAVPTNHVPLLENTPQKSEVVGISSGAPMPHPETSSWVSPVGQWERNVGSPVPHVGNVGSNLLQHSVPHGPGDNINLPVETPPHFQAGPFPDGLPPPGVLFNMASHDSRGQNAGRAVRPENELLSSAPSLQEWVKRNGGNKTVNGMDTVKNMSGAPPSSSGLDFALLSSLLGLSSGQQPHPVRQPENSLGYNMRQTGYVQENVSDGQINQNQNQNFSQRYGSETGGYQQTTQASSASLQSLLGALSNYQASSTHNPSGPSPDPLPSQYGASPFPPGSLGDIATRLYGSYQGNPVQDSQQHELMNGQFGQRTFSTGHIISNPADRRQLEEGNYLAMQGTHALNGATPSISGPRGPQVGNVQQLHTSQRPGNSETAYSPSYFDAIENPMGQPSSSLFMQNDPRLPMIDRVHRSSTPPQNGVIGRNGSGLLQGNVVGSGTVSGMGFGQTNSGVEGGWTPPTRNSGFANGVGGDMVSLPAMTESVHQNATVGQTQGHYSPNLGFVGSTSIQNTPVSGNNRQLQPWIDSPSTGGGFSSDDYGWLDQYTHVRPRPAHETFKDGQNLGLNINQWEGAATSLWGDGQNKPSGFNTTSNTTISPSGFDGVHGTDGNLLPFPGMRSPQQQKVYEWVQQQSGDQQQNLQVSRHQPIGSSTWIDTPSGRNPDGS